MPYFILGAAILGGLYFIWRGLHGAGRRNLLNALAALAVIGGIAAIVIFAASERFGPFGWLLLLLVPLLFRLRQIRQIFDNLKGPTPGRSSDIRTRFLHMTLDHDSGVLRGTVLEGAHRGRNLDEMSVEQLLDLLRQCRVEDPESAKLLETYLDRVHGAEWRTGAGGGDGDGGAQERAAPGGGAMTPEQAYDILGLKPGASPGDIREAHRRLLKVCHPDRGGSTWLAAQINLAKDLLLPDG